MERELIPGIVTGHLLSQVVVLASEADGVRMGDHAQNEGGGDLRAIFESAKFDSELRLNLSPSRCFHMFIFSGWVMLTV